MRLSTCPTIIDGYIKTGCQACHFHSRPSLPFITLQAFSINSPSSKIVSPGENVLFSIKALLSPFHEQSGFVADHNLTDRRLSDELHGLDPVHCPPNDLKIKSLFQSL